MKRLLLVLCLLLTAVPSYAQLNCSGGIFGCTSSVVVGTDGVSFVRMGLGTGPLTTSTLVVVPTGTQGQGTNVIKITDAGNAVTGFTLLSNTGTVETILGTDSSAGGGLGVGTAAFASVFGSAGNNAVNFITNNNLRWTISTAGAFTAASGSSLASTTVNDSNGNPFVLSSATASAVDSITITNAATANPATVTLAASGTDSNINTSLGAKGSGMVQHATYMQATSNRVALTADWTCGNSGTVSTCTAAVIIGSGGGVPLTFTLPLQSAPWHWQCDGVVGQATAATANSWNFLTATNGATNVTASYSMNTAATAMTGGATTDQASTTSTVVIGPAWTLGGTATKMPFHIAGTVEGAAAAGTVLSLQLVAPTTADVVTIYRGASCTVGL